MAYGYGETRKKIRELMRSRLTARKRVPLRKIVPGWAVIVGINHYDHYQPLECCVADALGMYILLTEPEFGGFNPSQVRLLLDPKLAVQDVRTKLAEVQEHLSSKFGFTPRPGIVEDVLGTYLEAEIGSIFKEVKRAAENCIPEQQLLVYFAGHGWQTTGRTFLLPPNAQQGTHEHTSVSLNALVGVMKTSPAAQHIVIADACFSSPEKPERRDLPPGIAILASSAHAAYEVGGHGLMTGYLFEALAMCIETANDGYVTLADAYKHVFPKVTQWVALNAPHDPFQRPILRAADAAQIVLSGNRLLAPVFRPNRIARRLIMSGLSTLAICLIVWLAVVASSINRGKDVYIALMPLKPVGDSQSINYLALGIVESLYARLFEWSNVHMPSETSLERAANLPPAKVAHDLGVSLVLQGTFQAEGDRIRLTFDLEDVPGNRTLWRRQFEGSQKGVFRLQDEVYLALIDALPRIGHKAEVRGRRPKSEEADELYIKARQAMKSQQTEAQVLQAIANYRSALSLDADFALARAKLADACMVMHWQYQRNDRMWMDEALLAAKQAVDSAEDLPEAHVSLATVYTEMGRSDAAFQQLKRALQLAPNSDELYRSLGRAYLGSSPPQKDNALAAFRKAVEINPYYWNNHFQLAGAYSHFGDFGEALCSYVAVTERVADRWEGYGGQAKAYLELGEFNASIAKAQKALLIQPIPNVLANLGTAYFYLGDFEEAREAWESAAKGNDQLAIGNLADAYRALKRPEADGLYDKAIKLIYPALEVNPRSPELLGSLALYLAKTNRVREGVAKMDEAIGLESQKPDLLYSQAVVLAIANEDARALAALRKCFEVGMPAKRAKTDPDFEKLRTKPEFADLMRQFDKPRQRLACEK